MHPRASMSRPSCCRPQRWANNLLLAIGVGFGGPGLHSTALHVPYAP